MTTRNTLQTRGIFTDSAHFIHKPKAAFTVLGNPVNSRLRSQRQELFQDGNLVHFGVGEASTLEQVKNALNTNAVHDIPGNAWLVLVDFAVAARDKRPGVVCSDVTAKAGLDSVKDCTAVVTLNKASTWPELIVNVGNGNSATRTRAALPNLRVMNQAYLKAAFTKKEAAKLGSPKIINRNSVNISNHSESSLPVVSQTYHNSGSNASVVYKQQNDQWEVLLSSASIAGATVGVAPGFQDRMMANYFQVPQAYGITFVVTNAIDISGTAAYGLLYVPRAIAVDTRKPFSIEPERDASRQVTEFNASMWYFADQYDANAGICLYHNAATPS
jgi:hypothetical protein